MLLFRLALVSCLDSFVGTLQVKNRDIILESQFSVSGGISATVC